MDEAEILTIAVRSDVQNMGIGKSLAEKHILNLNYAGIKFIFLEVSEENKNALSLYNCLGFHVVGRRDGYYAGPNGKRVSALTMKLTIP